MSGCAIQFKWDYVNRVRNQCRNADVFPTMRPHCIRKDDRFETNNSIFSSY